MKMVHQLAYAAAVCLIATSIQSCANQQMPDGGPVDRTTPEIISTYPANNTIHFSDKKIRFEFDRYVEERSVEESIFISPYVGGLEFDWSGKEVEIDFSEQLHSNTTYVVNVGTDVKDLNRNQKRMARAFTLAFSTGADIDRGAIEGTVYPMKPDDAIDNIMIFAYRLDRLNEDTLNPKTLKPDFITQTGKNGSFFLRCIPFGTYRVFAIRDEYRNLVYDPDVDEYGVQSSIIKLTSDDTLSSGVLMKLAKEDSTGPRLIKATASDRNHTIAEFSKSLDNALVTLSSFSIVDTMNLKPLDLFAVYPLPTNQMSFVLVTEAQDSTKEYRLVVEGVTDSIGNKINLLARSLMFHGGQKSDTLGPRLTAVSIRDSLTGVDPRPILTLTFSDALAKTSSLDLVNILDNKKQLIPAEKKLVSDVIIQVSPAKDLESKTWYTLRAELRGLHGWAGRTCRDSTKLWRFETLDIEEMSSIEGAVLDKNTQDTSGYIFVQTFLIGDKTAKPHISRADALGRFVIPQIAEGRYVLQAFRDRNNNGSYDPGKPFPFIFSERQSPLSDTLKVRARWPLEGVMIQMK